ncbi:hypothetical protein EV363DRAFT_1269943 [Boletus edulis]|nr:hypothetical protein EV363DRAFT_1269943 [Boletus edulis]
MELHKFISDVLDGKARVLSFDNVVFGPGKDITPGVLSALNFARLAFAAEGSTPVLSQIISLLCSKKTVDTALAICREWPSGLHVEVEDVYHIPLFEMSLKPVSTDYVSPNLDRITSLLKNLRTLNSSSAVLIARYPDVITCLRLRAPTQDVFVLFNPRVSSEDEQVASLTFCISLQEIAQRLCDVFPVNNIHTQAIFDRQAQLLQKCTGHVFVPRATYHDDGEESLIMSSLTLLTLRAELEELTRDNGGLKRERQRLEKSIVDLEAQLEGEKAKANRAQFSKPSVMKTTWNASVLPSRDVLLTKPSRSTSERDYFFDAEDEMDPGLEFALQLQAKFDSENEKLLKQRGELMRTAQRQYHCGICLDDFPEDDAVHIDACGHDICRDCARGHVCNKIEEHRFPVICPVCMADHKNQNPGTIPGTLVQLLGVSEEQWATWVEMEIAQFSISIDCRKCQHSGFVDREDLEANSEIRCPFPACDHVWCQKCQQTIEPDGSKHSCDGTAELDHLMKQQGWRYCPNCKTPIQKFDGCNHLSCIAPGCNTHFCYRCGQTINRTAIPNEIMAGKTAHFRTCAIF